LGSFLKRSRFSPLRSLLTYLLTPWNRVLLEKLTGLQLVKKFPAFYGTRRFITALTSARHLSNGGACCVMLRLKTPPRRSEWGSSLPPDCFVSRGNISHVFRNIIFYGVGLLALRPTPNLEDQGIPFSLGHHPRPVWHGRPYQ
jgi:hypothetical protein